MSLARSLGIFMFKKIEEWLQSHTVETDTGCIGAEQYQREEASQQVNIQPQGIVRGCQWLRDYPFKASQRTLFISLTCPVLLMVLSYNQPLKVSSYTF